jgi:acyl carrier protein
MITNEKAKELFASINGYIKAEELKDNINLTDQGIESLDTFDFFLQVEEEYGVNVPDNQIEMLNTIQKIVDYVNKSK